MIRYKGLNLNLKICHRLMWKTTPITLCGFVALIPFLDPPGVLSFNWSYNNTLAILLSAILGFLLQWSGALALGYVKSHAALSVFDQATCLVLTCSDIFFSSVIYAVRCTLCDDKGKNSVIYAVTNEHLNQVCLYVISFF